MRIEDLDGRALAAVSLIAAGLWTPLGAQEPPSPDRRDALVAATGTFRFYSDARLNLHDLLVWRIESGDPVDPRSSCVADLPETQREAFREVEALYRERLGWSVADRRRVLLDLRFHLIGHPDVEIAPDDVVSEAVARLDAGLAAYEACWWTDHDARNRHWIAEMLPRVRAHEDAVMSRLARLYEGEWALPIPVDVVGYSSRTGANTIVNPDHILLSGAEGVHEGYAGLEILFHEASHTLVHPRFGAVGEALAEASGDLGLDRPPPELWHVVLFYTTGRVVESSLEEAGVDGYEPYLYAEGLFERAWPEYRAPVETHWQPYIDGETNMREAMAHLVRAVAN